MGNDPFRTQYRELSPAEKEKVEAIKSKASELLALITPDQAAGPAGRCGALAITNLEQSVMWAVKGITG